MPRRQPDPAQLALSINRDADIAWMRAALLRQGFKAANMRDEALGCCLDFAGQPAAGIAMYAAIANGQTWRRDDPQPPGGRRYGWSTSPSHQRRDDPGV